MYPTTRLIKDYGKQKNRRMNKLQRKQIKTKILIKPDNGFHQCIYLSVQAVLVFLWILCSTVQAQDGHGNPSPTTLDELVITAERLSDYAAENPNLVVEMGHEEILQRNLRSISDTLNAMPGVEVKGSSAMGSRISIRGSGKSGGVLVLLNGRPLNSSQYGGVDLSAIPIDMVTSIMVFKPPVPVWLGAGATEGAINIVTRETDTRKKQEKKQATRISAAGGSYGLAEGSVSHMAGLGSGNMMVSASGKHKDGERENSDMDSGALSLHWDKTTSKKQRMEFDTRFYKSEYGSTGPMDNPTPDARQSYQKLSADGRVSGLCGTNGDFAVNVYGDRLDLEDQSQSGFVSTLDSAKVGAKGEFNWSDDDASWSSRTSMILEYDDLDHTLSGSHHRTTLGLGTQVNRKWTAVSATVGVRGDQVRNFGFNPGYSAGISRFLNNDWTFKINTGYTVNIPSFGQLYQPSHGSIDQVRGNPDLDEEKIWSSDISLEFRKGKSRFFLISLFRTDTRDTILYLRDTSLIFQPVNGGRSWRHGLEATWKHGFETGLTADANLILQDSEITDTGNQLVYTPHVKATFTLAYALKGLGTRMEGTLRYNSKQYSEMENRKAEQLDDYCTVDAKVIQPFKIRKTQAEWFISINNLFDTEFESHFGYPDDGIRFVSGLNLTF